MKKEKHLPTTLTCRVNVDYDKQKISIVNPRKEKIRRYDTYFIFSILISAILMIFFTLAIQWKEENSNSTLEFNSGYIKLKNAPYCTQYVYHEKWFMLKLIGMCFLAGFIIMKIMFLFKIEKSKTKVPKFLKQTGHWLVKKNIKLASKPCYYIKFKGKNKKIIELPFDNVCLFYKTSGDYNKYLSKIDIKEMPVYHLKKKGRGKKCYYFWKAQFIFKKAPEKGWLEIQFK